MLQIEDQTVFLTRGDDAVLEVELQTDGGEAWALDEGDCLTLTVRELPSETSEALVSVSAAPGSRAIVLRHADTAGLKPGQYSADIQLRTADGRYLTVWPRLEGRSRTRVRNYRNFVIMSEVTIP